MLASNSEVILKTQTRPSLPTYPLTVSIKMVPGSGAEIIP